MAFDNSPTQNRIIAAGAFVTGVTLIALKFVFDSYFVQVMEDEHKQKLPANTEIAEIRAEAEKRLTTGSLPLAQAKKSLGERGRDGFPEIQPKASDDTRALVGWSKLPKPATDVHAEIAPTGGAPSLTSGSVPAPALSTSSSAVAPQGSAHPPTPTTSAKPASSAAPAHGAPH